ncbi:MAG: hypothetical protein ACKO1Y_06330 [Actinomycetota bacterium]
MHARRRRRKVVAGVGAVIILGAVLLAAFGAGATPPVTNPGAVSARLDLSLLTLGENQIGIRTIAPAAGTVEGNGTFTIPAADLAFAPRALRLDVGERDPLVVVVETLPASDVRGRLDPRTGIAIVGGLVEQRWTVKGSGATCSVGPLKIGAGTGVPGARRYDEQTGAVTVVDPTPELAAVDPATPGCADLAPLVNDELALPIATTTTTTTTVAPTSTTTTSAPATTTTADPLKLAAMPPPVPSFVLTLTFDPAPSARTTRSSTTTATAPATTAAPEAPTPTTRAAQARPAAPARPTRRPPTTVARPVQSETVRQALLRAERSRTVLAIPPALSQRDPGWFPSLGDIDPAEIPDALRVRPTRSAGETLRALPAGAIRTSTTGPLIVVPLVALIGLGYVGFRLIRSELTRSRPRHRFTPPSAPAPPGEDD